MPLSPLARWNDDRLDDMKRRVDGIEPTVLMVRELRVEMRGLARELEANTKGQERIAKQFEEAQLEPFTRSRSIRSQWSIAIGSAVVGGGIAVLGALLAGAH